VAETAKLSKLQKWILSLARENKQREGREFNSSSGADVFYAEVMSKYFDFPTQKSYSLTLRQLPAGPVFSPEAIGRGRYNSAQVAISRAVLRLQIRGLVEGKRFRHSTWAGCNLTPAGLEVARALANLTVKSG
jgi:hypothetical protein